MPLIVDNTMPTPYLLQPLEHGADIVVHSATKFIGGHGTSIGGVIVDGGKFDWAQNGKFPGLTEPDPSYHGLKFTEALGPHRLHHQGARQLLRDVGAALSPFNAFLFLRASRRCRCAWSGTAPTRQAVAEYLEAHAKVAWVTYPGLRLVLVQRARREVPRARPYGAIVGFGIKGGREAGRRFVEGTKLFSHLANIGDAKSLCIHPATTTHSQLTAEEQLETGVTDDFVRLSVGLETIDDIIADLDQALAKA